MEWWLSLYEIITMLVDLSKKELNLLGIALAEYQFDKENWYLQEVKELNIKLMNIRNACTCKED
tara:strand:- start:1620 stop:1811 length:192 start_codon:yes stop_codon:yes gene_type:complete